MSATTVKAEFDGHLGARLAARLDIPAGTVRGFALFAHCFTCSKDLMAVRRIATDLARAGIAVMRFDFTGLGASEGEFASTNFSSNVGDLLSAADYLRSRYEAPSILIGHSLGGAAVLAVAGDIPEVKAVVTIGAPSDVAHVLHNFGGSLEEIEQAGQAEVTLSGRTFTIQKQFIEDARSVILAKKIAAMKKALLVLHSPVDETVGISNASDIFQAARHPKSFVSLDRASHLLQDPSDAAFAAGLISAWVSRYLPADQADTAEAIEHVRVSETGTGKFQAIVQAGRHRMFADEPVSIGGLDSGPTPYGYLSGALGSCTSMTIRMYANFKKIDLGRVSVDVKHDKIHAEDCVDCTEDVRQKGGKIDQFERIITVDGDLSEETRAKIAEIADKCPVHRTLENVAIVKTSVL